jgi:hypothetical protein
MWHQKVLGYQNHHQLVVVRLGDERQSSLTPATSFLRVMPFSWDIFSANTLAYNKCSPGHATSGDALHIAPAYCQGYQNGQQGRYICSSLAPILFDQIVLAKSKTPFYGPFKLMTSSNINLIGVISLCVCYWPAPTTMNAVLATIVAGGQA